MRYAVHTTSIQPLTYQSTHLAYSKLVSIFFLKFFKYFE
jgi:hypothetical protein